MRKTQVFSIFGEIEELVAKQMMAEGKGITRLSLTFDDLPPSCRVNQFGQGVRLVIAMPNHLVHEYERRVADLRS